MIDPMNKCVQSAHTITKVREERKKEKRFQKVLTYKHVGCNIKVVRKK